MFGLANHGQRGSGGVVLDERHFRMLEKFSNKESEWESWQANVEVAVATVTWGSWRVLEGLAKVDEVTDPKLNDIYVNVVLDLKRGSTQTGSRKRWAEQKENYITTYAF